MLRIFIREAYQHRMKLSPLQTLIKPSQPRSGESPWLGYALAVAGWLMVTAGATGFAPWLGIAGTVLGYLLLVTLIAARFGTRPALFATLLSVAVQGWVFTRPSNPADMTQAQLLVAGLGLLGTALVLAYLIADLRLRAHQAALREQRAQALYTMSRELSSALMVEQIVDIASLQLDTVFQAQVWLLVPDAAEKLFVVSRSMPASAASALRLDVAQWVYDKEQAAGMGNATLPGSAILYLPLKAPMRSRGVLAIAPRVADSLLNVERRRLLDAFTAQIALALERVHYVRVAQDAEVSMASERLRNSILSAISHDLRTPLTSLIGLASALLAPVPLADAARSEVATAIQEEALRMNALVVNLLEMARLEVGRIRLNKQWQMAEEVVGSAIRASRLAMQKHRIETQLAGDLPLVAYDAVLVERVLCNLLENAGKYTPTGSRVKITVQLDADNLQFSVQDDGPGLPAGSEDRIFEKFARGVDKESNLPGVGLGLAICRAIVEAHGGHIGACNAEGGGALFTFSLPATPPPPLDESCDMHKEFEQ